jgi:hypothetical protein
VGVHRRQGLKLAHTASGRNYLRGARPELFRRLSVAAKRFIADSVLLVKLGLWTFTQRHLTRISHDFDGKKPHFLA